MEKGAWEGLENEEGGNLSLVGAKGKDPQAERRTGYRRAGRLGLGC